MYIYSLIAIKFQCSETEEARENARIRYNYET